MNRNEFIGKLQLCYFGDRNAFNEIVSVYDELNERINKATEYIEYNNETLYTYEPDYDYEENIVSNYDVSSFREDLLEILKGDKR